MKTKYTITKKWEKKIEDMKKKADIKYTIILQNEKRKWEQNYEYFVIKVDKKKASYIKKKEEEYLRKMRNEIREMEWKPKKVYKTDAPKIKPIQFAMDIAQENARLRDTDADWNWYCISCNKYCSWWELAWWHRHSRRFTNMCLERENINAQCHTCNYTTWPRWDTVAKARVNQIYDENLDKKFWEWTANKLSELQKEWFKSTKNEYDLYMEIPRLIEENAELWKSKNFHAPKRNWYKTRTRYTLRT